MDEHPIAHATETEGLVDRLVSLHGEGGLCPTADDWHRIFAAGGTAPVSLLNLLKFRAEIDGPSGPISGADAYRHYAADNAAAFARVGGEVVFFGDVGHVFGLGPVDDWDAAIVTRYPTAASLAQMWLDPEFVTAHQNRLDGVARSQVLVFG